MKTSIVILSTLALSALATACAFDSIPPYLLTPEIHVETHVDVRGMGPEEVIDDAEAILLACVASVSPTRWNQDSGEIWEDPSV
jgi:hypothetical protein